MGKKKDNSSEGSPKQSKKKTAGKKAPKEKKAKDPNAPKKPLSGYMFFSNERRVTLKKEQPGLSFGDTTKTIAEEWNNMTEAQKKPYQDKAAADKERYAQAVKEYNK